MKAAAMGAQTGRPGTTGASEVLPPSKLLTGRLPRVSQDTLGACWKRSRENPDPAKDVMERPGEAIEDDLPGDVRGHAGQPTRANSTDRFQLEQEVGGAGDRCDRPGVVEGE